MARPAPLEFIGPGRPGDPVGAERRQARYQHRLRLGAVNSRPDASEVPPHHPPNSRGSPRPPAGSGEADPSDRPS